MSTPTDTPIATPMTQDETIASLGTYEYGWHDSDAAGMSAQRGLSEAVVRNISALKSEPQWMLDIRLKGLGLFGKKPMPTWGSDLTGIDFDNIKYFVRSTEKQAQTWEDLPEDIKNTYDRLGIPEAEKQRLVAGVAAQYESEVVYHQIREDLEEKGVIFVDTDTGLREHEDLFREYFTSVIPAGDNKFAALNTAVWSGGSFVYVPKGVHVEIPLQAYFRINTENMGQFERTLIIADEGSYVSYLEGCTAPMRDEHQLHAAVVELIALEGAEIRYSTVQNWYPGDEEGRGGVYNFVTKRGLCAGRGAKISWTQVETGSAITWKYPSVILKGDDSVGEFYSVALTRGRQQADTGTKMIHLGRNTRSTIVSKGIAAGHSQNVYRGLVRINPGASGARNYTQCDSLLIGPHCGAHTFPYIESRNPRAIVEHEASTSRVSEEQLFYCRQRGIDPERAVALIVGGFCKDVFQKLPLEFAVEAGKLLEVSLEGSVG